MKNRLVFRILGALASALIIASVFIPFVSVIGYSQSLWQTHQSVGTLYLPIMIIVFGVIAILVFSTNFKIELAYASAGALLFFLTTQTIPIIDQGAFSSLGVGYYSLIIGTVLIVIMAFLCGLKVKQKVVEAKTVHETQEVSMLDQIDKLYNDQSSVEQLSNPLNNIVEPLMPRDNNVIQPLPVAPASTSTQTIPVEVNDSMQVGNLTEFNPSLEQNTQTISLGKNYNENFNDSNVINNSLNNSIESEFNVPLQKITDEKAIENPTIAEFSQPILRQSNESTNPVINEFSINNQVDLNTGINPFQMNPVITEFNSETEMTNLPQMNQSIGSTTLEPIQPLNIEKKVDVMVDSVNNSSDLDIFG